MMKSADYLYDVLKQNPRAMQGVRINRKRYCIGAIPLGQGKWGSAVCRMRYETVFSVTPAFSTDEEAWEEFLKQENPRLLERWKALEATCTE